MITSYLRSYKACRFTLTTLLTTEPMGKCRSGGKLWILVLVLVHRLTLRKRLSFSVPQFRLLWNGDNNKTYASRLSLVLNGTIYVYHLEGLAGSRHIVNLALSMLLLYCDQHIFLNLCQFLEIRYTVIESLGQSIKSKFWSFNFCNLFL